MWEPSRKPAPCDYERSPERFRTARAVQRRHAVAPDIHGRVARRLLAEDNDAGLDIGCGEGELARHMPDGAWIGLDNSPTMLAQAPRPPTLSAMAWRFPFRIALSTRRRSSTSCTTCRILPRRSPRHIGCCAPAGLSRSPLRRHDSPELAHALPRRRLTFDAELAAELLGELFGDLEVERSDVRCSAPVTSRCATTRSARAVTPRPRGPPRRSRTYRSR